MARLVLARSFCFIDDGELHSSEALLLKRPIQDVPHSISSKSGSSLFSNTNLSSSYDSKQNAMNSVVEPVIHKTDHFTNGKREGTCSQQDFQLQDDSFVNFSVGHSSRHQSSVINFARYAIYALASPEDQCAENCSAQLFSQQKRQYHFLSKFWRIRKRKEHERPYGEPRFDWLAPIRRCFYY